jgi:hypothetical protein
MSDSEESSSNEADSDETESENDNPKKDVLKSRCCVRAGNTTAWKELRRFFLKPDGSNNPIPGAIRYVYDRVLNPHKHSTEPNSEELGRRLCDVKGSTEGKKLLKDFKAFLTKIILEEEQGSSASAHSSRTSPSPLASHTIMSDSDEENNQEDSDSEDSDCAKPKISKTSVTQRKREKGVCSTEDLSKLSPPKQLWREKIRFYFSSEHNTNAYKGSYDHLLWEAMNGKKGKKSAKQAILDCFNHFKKAAPKLFDTFKGLVNGQKEKRKKN